MSLFTPKKIESGGFPRRSFFCLVITTAIPATPISVARRRSAVIIRKSTTRYARKTVAVAHRRNGRIVGVITVIAAVPSATVIPVAPVVTSIGIVATGIIATTRRYAQIATAITANALLGIAKKQV